MALAVAETLGGPARAVVARAGPPNVAGCSLTWREVRLHEARYQSYCHAPLWQETYHCYKTPAQYVESSHPEQAPVLISISTCLGAV